MSRNQDLAQRLRALADVLEQVSSGVQSLAFDSSFEEDDEYGTKPVHQVRVQGGPGELAQLVARDFTSVDYIAADLSDNGQVLTTEALGDAHGLSVRAVAFVEGAQADAMAQSLGLREYRQRADLTLSTLVALAQVSAEQPQPVPVDVPETPGETPSDPQQGTGATPEAPASTPPAPEPSPSPSPATPDTGQPTAPAAPSEAGSAPSTPPVQEPTPTAPTGGLVTEDAGQVPASVPTPVEGPSFDPVSAGVEPVDNSTAPPSTVTPGDSTPTSSEPSPLPSSPSSPTDPGTSPALDGSDQPAAPRVNTTEVPGAPVTAPDGQPVPASDGVQTAPVANGPVVAATDATGQESAQDQIARLTAQLQALQATQGQAPAAESTRGAPADAQVTTAEPGQLVTDEGPQPPAQPGATNIAAGQGGEPAGDPVGGATATADE